MDLSTAIKAFSAAPISTSTLMNLVDMDFHNFQVITPQEVTTILQIIGENCLGVCPTIYKTVAPFLKV